MATKPSLLYALIFAILFNVYWLFSKIHIFLDRIIKSFNISANSLNKIQQRLNSLNKIPTEVILAIEIDGKARNEKERKNIIDNLIYYVEIIRLANVKEIRIFFCGSQDNLNSLRLVLEQDQYKQVLGRFQMVNFDKFHSSLVLSSLDWNKKSVPLLISIGSYYSLNCIPFNNLIDAQFVFCPPITQCLPIDIKRCFEQYAASKQRHGK